MNHAKTFVDNGLGETRQVTDAANSDPVTYAYGYTPFGQLATVTDPNGNTSTYTYNRRSFKTAMDDPDMGAWSYAYNAAGDRLSQPMPRTAPRRRATTRSAGPPI